MSHKSELESVEFSDDLDAKVVLRRSLVFSQDRLVGARGTRGFALCALIAIVCGLYWYQHHRLGASSLSQRPYYHTNYSRQAGAHGILNQHPLFG